jgi:hypothetical protein
VFLKRFELCNNDLQCGLKETDSDKYDAEPYMLEFNTHKVYVFFMALESTCNQNDSIVTLTHLCIHIFIKMYVQHKQQI